MLYNKAKKYFDYFYIVIEQLKLQSYYIFVQINEKKK